MHNSRISVFHRTAAVARSGCRTRSRMSRFMDELAAHLKVTRGVRLRRLSNARLIEVVKAAAKAAALGCAAVAEAGSTGGWHRGGRGGRARHLLVAYEGQNGYAAMIAEVGGRPGVREKWP